MPTVRKTFIASMGGKLITFGMDVTEADIPADTQAPSAPVNLAASASAAGITLSWDANTETDVVGYNVYRASASNGTYAKINGLTLVGQNSYLDTGATVGVLMFYKVTAVDRSSNESQQSLPISERRTGGSPNQVQPAAPTGLAAVGQDSGISLNWDDLADANLAGYHVERATAPAGQPFTRLTAGLRFTSDYLDTTAPVGAQRHYRVIAVNTTGIESLPSSVASAVRPAIVSPDTTPPAAPTGLGASALSDRIALDWNNNAESDLAGYNVYRAASGTGPFVKINLATVTASMYPDMLAPPDQTSHYRVTAVDTAGNESLPSNTASATRTSTDTTPPAQPFGLAAAPTSTHILLTWTNNSEADLAGYNVWRTEGSATGAYVKLNTTGLVRTITFADSTATPGIPFWYRITALDTANNESTPSGSVPATRPLPDAGGAFTISQQGTMAPAAVHVHCLNLSGVAADPLRCRCQWDFGDTGGGANNTMEGWNAAHLYPSPGTFGITLTVTYANGTQSIHRKSIEITADTRTLVYVDTGGNNGNSGLTPGQALQTFAAAVAKVTGPDFKILLRNGQTHDMTAAFGVRHNNLVIDAWSSGAQAILRWTGGLTGVTLFSGANELVRHVVIQNIALTSNQTSSSVTDGIPRGIRPNGANWTVFACTFGHVFDGMNIPPNKPSGVLVANCVFQHPGIRQYPIYFTGTDLTIVGCTMQGNNAAKGGHNCRGNDYTRLNISSNTMSNPVAGGISAQKGDYAYIRGNTMTNASLGFGPLGDANGHAAERSNYAVIENNRSTGEQINVAHGASHVMVRNNISTAGDTTATGRLHTHYQVDGWNTDNDSAGATYNRGNTNVLLLNNTAINTLADPRGRTGKFLDCKNPRMDSGNTRQLTIANNLFVAPTLVSGTSNTAACFIRGSSLSGMLDVGRNVWPVLEAIGAHYVWPTTGSGTAAERYRTPAEWLTLGAHDETYEDVTLDVNQQPPAASVAATAARKVSGVVTDINGKIRVGTNWTAGAVQR